MSACRSALRPAVEAVENGVLVGLDDAGAFIGIGFAVPIDRALDVAEDILTGS